ncbi:MAG: hypothetical protein AMJ53_00350 [Gammaproteobacteria bacterium SG8_11]|nr:MAG: hypothetical protein AMJ53_00350 [Gammaproteobacteria bacterium SG8_11]
MELKQLIDLFEKNFLEYARLIRKIGENNSRESSIQSLSKLKIHIRELANLEEEIVELRLKKILKEEHPYLPTIDVQTIQNNSSYQNQPFLEICNHFLKQKKEVLKMLYSLPAENWNRTGVHEREGHIAFKEFIRRMTEKDKQILGDFKSSLESH